MHLPEEPLANHVLRMVDDLKGGVLWSSHSFGGHVPLPAVMREA